MKIELENLWVVTRYTTDIEGRVDGKSIVAMFDDKNEADDFRDVYAEEGKNWKKAKSGYERDYLRSKFEAQVEKFPRHICR